MAQVWTPIGSSSDSGQYWRNTQTGQVIYGKQQGFGLIDERDPQTGKSTGYFYTPTQSERQQNQTLGDRLKQAALGVAPFVAAPVIAKLAGAGVGTNPDGSVKNTVTDMNGNPVDTSGNPATAGKSFLDNPYVKEALSIGTGLGSSLITSGSIDRAQAAQKAATDKALALNTSIYQQARASLDPFVSRGNSAGNTLAALYGITPSSPSPTAPSAPVMAPTAAMPAAAPSMPPQMSAPLVTRGPQTLASMAAPSPAQSVAVKAPTGQVYMVPQAQLQEAIAQGGVPLNG